MAQLPKRVGPYEIDSRIGAGGMAETYRATRRGPGGFVQHVCLKRIRPDMEDQPDFVRQFLAEARIAASLRHASIAQVLDFGQDGEDYYLALELIDGVDLRQFLDAQPGGIDPDLAAYLAHEVATALDVAHRATSEVDHVGIVHRDISPSNVLLSTEGEVKLTDFGIARSIDGPKHTATGVVKGKVPYMAPEYARTGRVDVRIDLFGLGVLLYECLAGHRPYDGATDIETFERTASGRHQPVDQLAPGVAPELARTVEQLIQPDLEQRPPTAAAVLQVLSQTPVSGSVRRQLAAAVGALLNARRGADDELGSAATVAHPSSAPPVAGSTVPLAHDPAVSTRTSPRSRPATAARPSLPRRRAGLWLTLGALTAVGLGGWALTAGLPTAHGPEGPTEPPASLRAGTAPAPVPPPAQAPHDAGAAPPTGINRGSEAPTAPTAPAPLADTRARLKVIVIPFGVVFIDGRRMGDAPIQTTLRPGDHRIAADTPGGRIQRTVTLTAGQSKRVVLR